MIIKLPYNKDSADFFASLYFAPDSNCPDHTVWNIHRILTLWATGHYHVYCPITDNLPIGICHGQNTVDSFYGHMYFMREFRGKVSVKAVQAVANQIKKDLSVKRIIADIPENNRIARALISHAGFIRQNENYVFEFKE